MGDYFRSWRRKIGVVTLGMACVFAGGWVRSFIIADSVIVPYITSLHFLDSFGGHIEYRRLKTSSVTDGQAHMIPVEVRSGIGVHQIAHMPALSATGDSVHQATTEPASGGSITIIETPTPSTDGDSVPTTNIIAIESLHLTGPTPAPSAEGGSAQMKAGIASGGLIAVSITPSANHPPIQWITTNAVAKTDPFDGMPIVQHWQLCGFGYFLKRLYIAEKSGVLKPLYETESWTIPYWSITIPLTLLSAFLLLSKPQKSNQQKITDPVPERLA